MPLTIPEPSPITARYVVPVTIAVVGWLVSHFFSLRAQRKAFQNATIDKARIDITAKLRDYQRLLSDLTTWISSLRTKAAMASALSKVGIVTELQPVIQEYLAIQGRKTDIHGRSIVLEDYQVLSLRLPGLERSCCIEEWASS